MLAEVEDFLKLTHKFNKTKRAIFATGEERMESDPEHCYQLAMLGWFLISSQKLNLNVDLVIKYALVHDLAEAITGDRHIFDANGRRGKTKREHQAIAWISQKFPDWDGYKELVKGYESLVDEESQFVYALDKALPVINIYMDGGKSWNNEGTTLQMILENKRKKVIVHPTVQKLWEELEVYMQAHEMELFGKPS